MIRHDPGRTVLPRGFAPLVIAGLSTLFWLPYLPVDSVLYTRDLLFYAVPSKALWTESIRSGTFPFWDPFLGAGMPFFADVSHQTLYPLNLVLLAAPDPMRGTTAFVVLHGWLAPLAGYALMRAYGIERWPAAWAGLAFGWSGYVLSVQDYLTYGPAVVWAPLGLACWRTGARRQEIGQGLVASLYGGAGALCCCGLLLAGDAVDAGILAAVAMILESLIPGSSRERARRVLRVGLLAAAGAGLAGVQVIPTLELASESVRTLGARALALTQWSFPPARLWELVHPALFGAHYPSHEFFAGALYPYQGSPWAASVYLGLVPVFAAVVAVVVAMRRGVCAHRTAVVGWTVVTVAAFLLSLGEHLPGYREVVEAGTLLATQRYPEKLVFWGTLGVSVLAGFGAMSISRVLGRTRRLRPFVFTGGVCAIVLATFVLLFDLPLRSLVWMHAGDPSAYWSARMGFVMDGPVTRLTGLGIHFGAILAVVVASGCTGRYRPRTGVALLLAASLADLWWVHHDLLPRAPASLMDLRTRPPLALGALRSLGWRGERVFFDEKAYADRVYFSGNTALETVLDAFSERRRALGAGYLHLATSWSLRERLTPNLGLAYRLPYLNASFSPLQSRANARAVGPDLREAPHETLARAAVRFVITPVTPRNPLWDGPGFVERYRERGSNLRILEVRGARPWAAFHNGSGAGGWEPARARRHGMNEIRVTLPERYVSVGKRTGDLRELEIRESYRSGWRATAGGSPVPVVASPSGYLRLRISERTRRVTLTYTEPLLRQGLAVSALTLSLLLLWIVQSRKSRVPLRTGS